MKLRLSPESRQNYSVEAMLIVSEYICRIAPVDTTDETDIEFSVRDAQSEKNSPFKR